MRTFVLKFRSGRLGALFALIAAIVVVAVFIAAAVFVRAAIEHNLAFQRDLRVAQVDRSRLLRLQLDEETGMRGYLATGSPIFLAPYTAARSGFTPTARSLEQNARALGVDLAPLRAEEALNEQWNAQVAAPSLRDRALGNTLAVQLRGKDLVDAFRSHDNAMIVELNTAADQGEARTNRLVSAILFWSIAGGVAIAAILAWLSAAQERLGGELEEQRRAYLEEKRVADALQEAFLQKTLPELAKADLHAVYMPAGLEAKVGGDWYDAFELSDNRILFSIGDVAGHGIEAAVVMSRVRQAVLSVGVEERDPASVLARANEILLLQDLTMVTAVCGMIDLGHGIITIANAGHPPAILLHADGTVEMLSASGPPLGALDRPTYATTATAVSPGSMLVLYTDGLIEYGRDWEAGEARLLEAIRSVDRQSSMDPAAAIMKAIFDGNPPVDDVAILTITFRESANDPQPVTADLASASARPLLDRSVRALLESVIPQAYARASLAQLDQRGHGVESKRNT